MEIYSSNIYWLVFIDKSHCYGSIFMVKLTDEDIKKYLTIRINKYITYLLILVNLFAIFYFTANYFLPITLVQLIAIYYASSFIYFISNYIPNLVFIKDSDFIKEIENKIMKDKNNE